MADQYSSKLTRLIRVIHLLFHIARGLLTAALVLPRVTPQKRDQIISRWSKRLLDVFNIRLVTHGCVPDQSVTGVMFVANHVSWIDIYAINSVRTVRFVAMAEIRKWPVFGWLATQVNTLFTDRAKRHDAGRMVEMTANSLRNGDCLCYFPEGTTSDGTELKPFKNSLMQAAVNAGTRIWPVAIRYPGIDGEVNTELSYSDLTLWSSIKKVLSQQSPAVELYFGQPIAAEGLDRRQLSAMARTSIAESLGFTQ